MSLLQRESSAWDKLLMMMMIRTKDLAAQEILRERWEAIESGKLKGRRLFVPEEDEAESEVRSLLSFGYSEDDESSGSQGEHHFAGDSSSPSSSSPCVFSASVDNGLEVKGVKDMAAAVEQERGVDISRSGNGGRYAVFLGRFTVALLLIAICLSSGISSRGRDYEAVIVPT